MKSRRHHRSSSSRSSRVYRPVPGGEGSDALGSGRRRRRHGIGRRLKRRLASVGVGFVLFGCAGGILLWLAIDRDGSRAPDVVEARPLAQAPSPAIAPATGDEGRDALRARCPPAGKNALTPPLAAACGDTSKLKALITQPGMADATDTRPEFAGRTALHHAAQVGDTRMVALLLAAGANPNLADEKGNTPLHLVASAPHLQHPEFVARRLIDGGASTELRNGRGRTPIQELEADHPRLLVQQNLAKVLYQAEREVLMSQWLTPTVPSGERPLALPDPQPPPESVVVDTNEGRFRIPVDPPATGSSQ